MECVLNPQSRVVHVGKFYAPHFGGIETHVEALCRELHKSMKVRVLVANDRPSDEDSIVNGVPVSRFGIKMTVAGAPICPSMVWKIRQLSTELVHVHLPNPIGMLAALASVRDTHLIATWHSDVVRQRRLARILVPIERLFLRRCKAIIASSIDYVNSSPTLSRFKDRCHVIPYGIDVEAFQNPDRDEVRRIRGRFGPRIVLAVGRLVYYKGFEHLLRAMPHIDAQLLIIGDGPQRALLEREARALGVVDRVHLLGQTSEIVPYYHAADVFVLPSVGRSEAFGIVQLEAMASGKPVVNTRLATGAPWASLDGVTGITVLPANADDLARATNILLNDPELRLKYGKAGRTRVESEFSLQLMVRRTTELYDWIGRKELDQRSLATSFRPNAVSADQID
jgi:glycosyltransferase involved in cell wall biosynthesis